MKRLVIILIVFVLLMAGCVPQAAPAVEDFIPSPSTVIPTQADQNTLLPTDTPTLEPTQVPTDIPVPAEPTAVPGQWVAWIVPEGNLWLINLDQPEQVQLTFDAVKYIDHSTNTIGYSGPAWSSDGRYLLFEREVGAATGSGFSFRSSLQVYDFVTGVTQTVLENVDTVGYTWKPGSHQVTFAQTVDPNYFKSRNEVDTILARGIFWLDLDTGGEGVLVQPQAGYSLIKPRWSPDGQILSFGELVYMEGGGLFAYYDFYNSQYVRWEKAIGNVDWFPDGSRLLFDNLKYVPTFSERIYLVNRDGSGQEQLSPEGEMSYCYQPLFSKYGDWVAFLQVIGMDADAVTRLFVKNLVDGQMRPLVQYPQVHSLSWTPDGAGLLLTTGSNEQPQVVLVGLDGNSTNLGSGSQPVMQP